MFAGWQFVNNWNVVMNYLLLNRRTCHQKVYGISNAYFVMKFMTELKIIQITFSQSER